MFCLGGVCSGRAQATNNAPMTFVGYKALAVGQVLEYAPWTAVVFYTVWFLYVGMDTMAAHHHVAGMRFSWSKLEVHFKDPVPFGLVSSGLFNF